MEHKKKEATTSLWQASQVGSVIKNTPANVGDSSSILGSGRSPGEGNGNSFHYSSLENSIDRRAQWVTVHGVTKVRHDLVTKPPPPSVSMLEILSKYIYSSDR